MPETTLLVDVGNSRVKWAVHDGAHWLERGATAIRETDALGKAWAQYPIARALGVCVADDLTRARIESASNRVGITWITSRAAQADVINRYVEPQKLGADRWAALIAARQRGPGAWIVVNAGTAVTIDALAANGEFLGGLILPGLRLMFEALVSRTAGLKVDPGDYAPFPRATPDAMSTGAIDAVIGAVERMHRRLSAAGGDVRVLLSGGAADTLAPHMSLTVERTESVVLDGLLEIAKESRS